MAASLWLLLLIAFVASDSRLDEYRITDEVTSEQQLLYVKNEDLLWSSSRISKHLSIGSAVLFDSCDHELLSSILQDANFPISPDETIQMMMVHWYINDKNYKIYHIKEYDHYKLINGAIRSSDGSVKIYNDTQKGSIKRGTLFDDYTNDILDYTKNCVIKSSSHLCTKYLSSWYMDHGFKDQNGMQPKNGSSVWGEIETTLYYQGIDSFNSLIPYNIYIYGDANPSTLELQSIVIYMIAEGLHSQNQSDPSYCDVGGCRGIFHREMLIDLNANPTESYSHQDYHWIFSKPPTANGVTSVITSFSSTETQGVSATINADGGSMTFSSSHSETYGYSQSEQVNDFTCDELTDGADTIGSWHYFQTEPVNIVQYPLTNFPNDWEHWYSNQWNPCTIVSGPNLASASMQTSNAIKWQAAPSLVNFKTATFNINYYVSVKVEQDHIWCNDWSGHPPNPCNTDGSQHHCEESVYSGMGPAHKANIIQAMHNINTTSIY